MNFDYLKILKVVFFVDFSTNLKNSADFEPKAKFSPKR